MERVAEENSKSVENLNELRTLSEFFSISYQQKLIKIVQINRQTYDEALMDLAVMYVSLLHELIKKIKSGEIQDENNRSNLNKIVNVIEEQIEEGKLMEAFAAMLHIYNGYVSSNVLSAHIEAYKYLTSNLKIENINTSEKLLFYKIDKPVYYRGRLYKGTLEKMGLFHISYKALSKVKNQRFGITGQPILYLASNIELMLKEIGVNSKQFERIEEIHVSQYTLQQSDMKIYDFRINDIWDYKLENEDEIKIFIYKSILTSVCMFPKTECNFDVPFFIDEYVIPQIIMQTFRFVSKLSEDSKIDGVCYPASSGKENYLDKRNNGEEEKGDVCLEQMNEHNLALFTDRNKNSDYDMELFEKFDITVPISYRNLYASVTEYKNACNLFIKDLCNYFEGINEEKNKMYKFSSKHRVLQDNKCLRDKIYNISVYEKDTYKEKFKNNDDRILKKLSGIERTNSQIVLDIVKNSATLI